MNIQRYTSRRRSFWRFSDAIFWGVVGWVALGLLITAIIFTGYFSY